MKKAVITILGTIGGNSKTCEYNPKWENAKYNSEINEIKETKDINSLPILIQSFQPKGYEIVSLYTKCAKEIQEKVIENHNNEIVKNYKFNDEECLIKDDKDYDKIFSQIDKLISKYDKVIIDVSHGYRHLPILMIVNTIMHNIDSIEKIEKIIFAKENEFGKEYTFIDLKRYLDLANISYALTTFDRNYTVANNVKVSDKNLNDFLENLSSFSKHILANSIDELLKDTNKQKSITTKLIIDIENLLNKDDTIFTNLTRLLEQTLKHLKEIKSYDDKIHFEKLYNLSVNMKKKGYYLNSITLLSEAMGMYCSLALKNISPLVKEKIEEFEKRALQEKNNENIAFKLYELYSQSKVLYKIKPYKYRGTFLKVDTYTKNKNNREKLLVWNDEAKTLTETILDNITQNEDIKNLITQIDDIRNNLAHANTSKRLKKVEEDIDNCLKNFNSYCIEKNILNCSR